MSTSATGLPPNVEIYLEALRSELADLAPDEREDLLSEVEPSLLEAAADGDDPIAARLGPPADFAADLRASAGLPPAPRAPVARPGLRAALAALAASPRVRRARAVAGELGPLWWAARACLAVGAIAVVFGIGWSAQWGFVPRYGSVAGTVVVTLVALAGSCALGLAARRGTLRRTSLGLSAATLVALPFVVDAASAPPEPFPFDAFVRATTPVPDVGLAYDGMAIQNIYAYDRAGRLLQDVRLYDQAGRPLEFGRDFDNTGRRILRLKGGATIFNSYPVRYFEPGTKRIANPEGGAPPAPPAITTPPLTADAARAGRRRDR
jgi:hypothetical protein